MLWLSKVLDVYFLHSCPGYNVNQAGNIVERNYTVKKDHGGGCVSDALKKKYVPLKQNKKLFCLKKTAQKVMLLLI